MTNLSVHLFSEEEELKIKEKKQKKKEYDKIYNEQNRERKKKYQKKYNKDNKEKINERQKVYRINNKDKIKIYNEVYYPNHKDQKSEYDKIYGKKYRQENKEKCREYRENNKDKIKIRTKAWGSNLKKDVLNILGGCKCVVCGDENISHLTVDHKDNTGNLDRKLGIYGGRLYSDIVNFRYPEDKIANLQVLCWNHNLSKRREFIDFSPEDQTTQQRYRTKLFKEALEFFGPCKCGVTELKFLSISHIHNDGAERRRNGERTGAALLSEFRKFGWQESLKEDFCLECFNCNCSKD
jgi:hypothetical protein